MHITCSLLSFNVITFAPQFKTNLLRICGTMLVLSTIRTPGVLRWSFLGFPRRPVCGRLWRIFIDPSINSSVFPLLFLQRTILSLLWKFGRSIFCEGFFMKKIMWPSPAVEGMSFKVVGFAIFIKFLLCLCALFCNCWTISSAYLLGCFCCVDILINLEVRFAWFICFSFFQSVFWTLLYLILFQLWQYLLKLKILQLAWFVNPESLTNTIGFFDHYEDDSGLHPLFVYVTFVSTELSLFWVESGYSWM